MYLALSSIVCMEPHGAAWGRMGPHEAWHGARPKNTRGAGGGEQARGTGCYLLRWRWANSPLALPSKHPIPADLSIADPTCSVIAGREGGGSFLIKLTRFAC
jgi:hypothetical protein